MSVADSYLKNAKIAPKTRVNIKKYFFFQERKMADSRARKPVEKGKYRKE